MTAFITKVQKNVLIAYSAPEQTSAETFLQININLLSNWGMIVCTHHRTAWFHNKISPLQLINRTENSVGNRTVPSHATPQLGKQRFTMFRLTTALATTDRRLRTFVSPQLLRTNTQHTEADRHAKEGGRRAPSYLHPSYTERCRYRFRYIFS